MAQFDLYRLADGTLVVDLQTDLIGLEATRIVAPLREEGGLHGLPRRHARGDGGAGGGGSCAFRSWRAVPAGELRAQAGSIAARRDELKRGLDILIDGF